MRLPRNLEKWDLIKGSYQKDGNLQAISRFSFQIGDPDQNHQHQKYNNFFFAFHDCLHLSWKQDSSIQALALWPYLSDSGKIEL